MQTDTLNHRIVQDYIARLRNRNVSHKSIMLSFCGVPGSGKTTLARKLARDLKAQYIQHDEIRAMICEGGLDPSEMNIIPISREVIDTIFIEHKNKFVIIDVGLDRSWELFFRHAKRFNAKTIVIRLNVPEETLHRRIEARNEDDFGKVKDLNIFIEQFNNCKRYVRADLELSTDYDYADALKQVTKLAV